MNALRIGVDLGGTKIEVVALNADNATLLRRRITTPAGDYEGVVEAIGSLVDEAERELGASACVGIGTPGVISPSTGLMMNANSTVLIGKPLKQDVEGRLDREIRMANDANCFALSEATDGAAVNARLAFAIILGTGVEAGITIDKRIAEGANGIRGEWGHNPLPWPADDERPGPPCYCGKRGCIEKWLSGPSLQRESERSGRSDALVRYKDRLARSLATVVNIVDPDTVVLGGGVSNVDDLYVGLGTAIARYAFIDRLETEIVKAHHGDSSGVRGAAMLWDRAFGGDLGSGRVA